MIVPFVGGAYKTRSPVLDAQTCINLFPVIDKKGGQSSSALFRTPGLRLFSDDSTHFETRALYELNSYLYAVIDDTIYSVDAAGTKTALANIATSTGRVSIVDNGLQLMLMDGVKRYVFTLSTNTLDTYDTFFSITAGYQDGYGLIPIPNSTTWYVTDIFDFGVINPADFASANQSSDFLKTIISSHQEAWLLSHDHSEVWYDTGADLFPFERRQTLVIQYGIAAPFSLVKCDNSRLFWLARNELSQGLVVALEGYTPKIISSEPVNYAINTYTRIDDAFAFAYEDEGHLFYVLTFPTADRTWVYDVATDEWHERRSRINNAEPNTFPTRQGRWRPNCYAQYNGKHIVGDFESGKLYEIDVNTYTENGTPITWERAGYHFTDDRVYLFCDNFELVASVGDGLNTGQGSDPQVMLQISKDMGITYGAEMWAPLGRQGEYMHRILWPALGAARDWIFRVRGDDPIPVTIVAARANFTKGT